MCIQPLCNLPFNSVEGTTTYKENIARIHRNVLLVRMLAPTLGRNVDRSAFQQFQKSLLHTLSADVTGDGGIITLTCYLVNLVNEDDAALRGFHIIIGHL